MQLHSVKIRHLLYFFEFSSGFLGESLYLFLLSWNHFIYEWLKTINTRWNYICSSNYWGNLVSLTCSFWRITLLLVFFIEAWFNPQNHYDRRKISFEDNILILSSSVFIYAFFFFFFAFSIAILFQHFSSNTCERQKQRSSLHQKAFGQPRRWSPTYNS